MGGPCPPIFLWPHSKTRQLHMLLDFMDSRFWLSGPGLYLIFEIPQCQLPSICLFIGMPQHPAIDTQTFFIQPQAIFQPSPEGLSGSRHRKIPLVSDLHHEWGDWLPSEAARSADRVILAGYVEHGTLGILVGQSPLPRANRGLCGREPCALPKQPGPGGEATGTGMEGLRHPFPGAAHAGPPGYASCR